MKKIFAAALALALLGTAARAESMVSEGEFANLQAVMQTHIERNLVNGALLQLDEATGVFRELFPAAPHPKIMAIGKYYYLCADFRDAEGKDVMVNFLAAKDDDRYVIFHTIFGEDHELEKRIEQQAKIAAK